MDTIRAVLQMSRDNAATGVPETSAGAAHLDQLSPGIQVPVADAIKMAAANGMSPDSDFATLTRLSSAIDRHAVDRSPDQDRLASFKSIMTDYLLQEAAGARLAANGQGDPLDHASDPDSARSSLRAAETLHRNGLKAHMIFDRASQKDIEAIAAGRYDRIEMDHTRFAVSSQLKLSARAMSIETVEPAASRTGEINKSAEAIQARIAETARAATLARLTKGPGQGPAVIPPGLRKGPETTAPVQPLGFGKKGVTER